MKYADSTIRLRRARSIRSRRMDITAAAALASLVLSYAHAEEPIPEITEITVASNNVELAVSNMDTGGTYYVELTDQLSISNNWVEVDSFEGIPGVTNWMDSIPGSVTSAFYRIVRDPYHEKVGAMATFGPPNFHAVSGTAHIINNRTIELRNFNFDGGGVAVYIYLSPNTTFNPYVSISENLLGTAFTNATLTLDVPEGTDFNTYTNISVWCTIGLSFSTGSFQ